MKTEKEILERIEHIKTLGKGYGINERRIKELEWVLKPSKVKNNVDLHNVSQQRELLDWLSNEPDHNIRKSDINEILQDFKYYQSNCG